MAGAISAVRLRAACYLPTTHYDQGEHHPCLPATLPIDTRWMVQALNPLTGPVSGFWIKLFKATSQTDVPHLAVSAGRLQAVLPQPRRQSGVVVAQALPPWLHLQLHSRLTDPVSGFRRTTRRLVLYRLVAKLAKNGTRDHQPPPMVISTGLSPVNTSFQAIPRLCREFKT